MSLTRKATQNRGATITKHVILPWGGSWWSSRREYSPHYGVAG